ncbi:MAG TPA: hypothetical protein VMB18_13185 [Terriglobales bacterium]|nr:hypothetical protein [Terriglobales bacterium]
MRHLGRLSNSLTASFLYGILLFLVPAVSAVAQSQAASIPRLIKFGGVVKDATGNPQTIGITFSLFKDEQGGSPLWLETQNVQVDSQGHYSVYLGSTKSEGLPQDVFISGEAHWLGVQVQGQAEQARTLLLSVPYALKAGDAATIGGLPPSAFVLAYPDKSNSSSSNNSSNDGTNQPNVGGSGTQNFIPIWTDNSGDLGELDLGVTAFRGSPPQRMGCSAEFRGDLLSTACNYGPTGGCRSAVGEILWAHRPNNALFRHRDVEGEVWRGNPAETKRRLARSSIMFPSFD